MRAALNKFNSIAGIYDPLARFVFGRSIFNAQIHLIGLIPEAGNVLVLGGGTGWIAGEILKIRKGVCLYYIEASEEMLERTRRRVDVTGNIIFVHGTEMDIPKGILFDAIVTNFFLDLFTNEKLDDLIRCLRSHMNTTTRWIITDFICQGKWWQKLMLKIMYFFFRIVAKIDSEKLPDWEARIAIQGFKPIAREDFYSGFIRTASYIQ